MKDHRHPFWICFFLIATTSVSEFLSRAEREKKKERDAYGWISDEEKKLWAQSEHPREDVTSKDINLPGQWCSCPRQEFEKNPFGKALYVEDEEAVQNSEFFS